MPLFSLKECKRDNSNTKQKVFIEYLYKKFGVSEDNEEFDNDYFTQLNEDDLIESLEYYISIRSVTGQVTAKNYITYLTGFFKTLSDDYNIKNEIFTNVDMKSHFIERSHTVISKLKETENKDVATDKQYEDLVDGIDKFLSNHSDVENEIYDEFRKSKYKDNNRLKIYPHFVSIITTKLVLKLALKALTIASLNVEDLNIEGATLYLNGTPLPLDEELVELLRIYLNIRTNILESQSLTEDKLFINYDGTPYLKPAKDRKHTASYGMLFKIMHDCVNTVSTELFSARTAQQWLNSGMGVSWVSKITGFSPIRCIELQSESESVTLEKLQTFLGAKIEVKKKERKSCPLCGNEIKAELSNWILVQFEDTIFYISKKELSLLEGDSDAQFGDDIMITDSPQFNLRFAQDMDEDIDVPENETVEQKNTRVKRYQKLVNQLKRIYGHKCQLCGHSFQMDNGNEYCEAHHIKELSKNGSQDPRNVIIVCSNHHRMFHYARNSIIIGDPINGERVIKIGEEEFKIPFKEHI
ncbi:HNH endonuclease [Caproicibacter fermentans]|uniref:HNH endonuclease n=1 Tax=Caproicibacter fermentans TaxID=2576756 RepID=A0A7G8TD88_9FIRM|nr:HNH endonuclease [Caproicibacter fermentans]QNK41579.1 HNH endonuclease [Caproicibacter fermentans]